MWYKSSTGAAWSSMAMAASLVLLAHGGSGGNYFAPVSKDDDRWGTLVAVTAVRGSTAKLPCRISSDNPSEPVLLVLWYKNASVTPVYSYDSRGLDGRPSSAGRPHQWGDEEAWGVEQRAWFDTSLTPAHLLVRDVRGQDEGKYTCKVHFRASPSWTQRVTLTVSDPPGFPRIQDGSGHRLEGPIGPYGDGTVVRMMCLSSGEPPPGLVWGGSGVELGKTTKEERVGLVARTWFTILASRATADTTITCSTTNASVSSGIMNTVSTTLKVNLAPLTVQLEAPGEWVSAGQQTSFRCRVVGSSPPPVVQWWLGGRRLTANAPLTSVGGNVSVSTVRLTPQPGDHKVPLVCKAYSPNLAGSVLQDQLILAVHFVPVATVSVHGGGSEAATVREGSTVTFTCHLQANPSVYNITWFHNGRALRGWTWGVEVNNATLRLLNVTAAMRGLYTCVGSNPEGDGQSNALNLNVEFTPVCAVQQRRHYLVAPGGAVTVSCQVDAYPTSLTFTWALKNDSERSPIQLHSVGREEGLTGHYTLRGVNQKSVEVLCSAQNDVGTQITPCKMTVYTEGRPGPVRNCSVNSHTASGYRVICEAGLPRGTNTQYTLLVYTQKGSEERSNSVSGDNNNDDLGNGRGGHASVSPILDKLLRNLTSSSPVFLVSGLRAGREFVLVVRAAGDEGVSPPVVLTAFTLTDNAQTVIGLPTGGGHTSGNSISSINTLSSSSSSSSSSRSKGSSGGGEDEWAATGSEGGVEAMASWILGLVPPLVMVLGTSLIALLLIALILVLLVMKFSARSRQQSQEHSKRSGEVTPEDNTAAPQPGSNLGGDETSESLAEGGSVGDGEGGVAEVTTTVAGDTREVGNGSEAEIEGERMTQAVPAEGHLLAAAHEGSLQGACDSQGGTSTWLSGSIATMPRLAVRWAGVDPSARGFVRGLRSIDTSVGTSTSSICTGVSQCGVGSVADMGTLRHASRTGSLSGISDLDLGGTAMLSSAHLSDITAAGQLGLAAAGVGGCVSVIGIGDFPNVGGMGAISSVGSMGVIGVPARTLMDKSGLHSVSTHQPLQVMPGAGVAARPTLPN
ncbi:uncharacterized protein LOC123504606 isoform X2 [Portunus trituberculatus]|uniref:uncharacterized protein LOC123504606 isoform X2 n=1 Tax=Portunus trituberculatus TaxID=210409 RepID=UPI001E1D16E8|nr:uncharacterized protein LOC123504606 isoform X2 [Portunus trituberculatus]